MLIIAMYSLMKNSLANIHSSIIQTPKEWESIKGPCRKARTQLRAVWVVLSRSLGLREHLEAQALTQCHMITISHSQNINFVVWTWRLEWSVCLIHNYVWWLALIKGSTQHRGQETERECRSFMLPPFQKAVFHLRPQPMRWCRLHSREPSISR